MYFKIYFKDVLNKVDPYLILNNKYWLTLYNRIVKISMRIDEILYNINVNTNIIRSHPLNKLLSIDWLYFSTKMFYYDYVNLSYFYPDGIITEKSSDYCINELLNYDKNLVKCNLSSKCIDNLLYINLTKYEATHQILYIIILYQVS